MDPSSSRADVAPTNSSPAISSLTVPVVLAPMAGGPGTPELAAAVSEAGGLGFLAAGYLEPATFLARITHVRRLTRRPFGVNVFVPTDAPGDPLAIERYAAELAPLARAHGVDLGAPIHDDDHYAAKIEVLLAERPAVASFTFGLPSPGVVERLQRSGVEVWATVTEPDEASAAVAVGADVVVVQGAEAGGHRGSFADHDRAPVPLADLLAVVVAQVTVPVVATGALMDGTDIGRVIDAGAAAGQLGTAFLLCPEAGTSSVHRRALSLGRATTLTRAFTGRIARGITNRWTDDVVDAPSAYPAIHHLTAPLRAHGRAVGDPEIVNLWAGTGHARARAMPATELVEAFGRELRSGGGRSTAQ